MTTASALCVLGAAVLGVAGGLQWGSLTAEPTGSPAIEYKSPPAPVVIRTAEARAIDADQLAGHVRRALREEFRLVLQEELSSILEASRLGESPEGRSQPEMQAITAEQREAREVAFGDAQRVLEDARSRGYFGPDSRDDLNSLVDAMSPEQHFEVMRELSVAVNLGIIEIEDDEDSEDLIF